MTDITTDRVVPNASSSDAALSATDVRVTFAVRSGGLRRIKLEAVRGVSLSVGRGRTLGIVGESGSGKSTLGRALLRLIGVSGGEIELLGTDITNLSQRRLRPLRRHLQMVFQDPYGSLDPAATVASIVGEPLRVHEQLSRREVVARVAELLAEVGLDPEFAARQTFEFSGGQRQRLAVARALATQPEVVVLDEAVSALDVSTQGQVLELLRRLQSEHGMSYIFIGHNLAVVQIIADDVGVMYLGKQVEFGPVERIYAEPAHPYTRALLAAVPVPDPRGRETRTGPLVTGEPPDPFGVIEGCVFYSRCAHREPVCRETEPTAVSLDSGGWVACHLYGKAPPRLEPIDSGAATSASDRT